MFKVICVGELEPQKNIPGYRCPDVLEKCTVIRQEIDESDGALMYLFAEYPPFGGYRFTFEARAFSPLNGPDEAEMMEQRQEEMAERMDKVWQGIVNELDKTDPA